MRAQMKRWDLAQAVLWEQENDAFEALSGRTTSRSDLTIMVLVAERHDTTDAYVRKCFYELTEIDPDPDVHPRRRMKEHPMTHMTTRNPTTDGGQHHVTTKQTRPRAGPESKSGPRVRRAPKAGRAVLQRQTDERTIAETDPARGANTARDPEKARRPDTRDPDDS
jgi:hypothetical protein